ncbi:hypothetical protein GCM10010168_17590 [Actinoplanes ianthinogenes]|uniref:STAS domain-containing protein n=1 Tax=Actinoplanes ianthinogenes TaxID=122358 RepID=A0ABN6CQA9_9ACTN|nr:SpoIIE family protein phosphatase [Actinoplanes ianthinogenes]BCJ47401.1 hypothetical protein Aiant_80580 [Actinoplanes ianthinogenes]GGR01560.1 hypothetical protein GCM10010168_17590 [Actinoplanes ianthinogenes]
MAEDLTHLAGDPAVIARVFDQAPLLILATEGADHRIVAATGAYRVFADRPHMVGGLTRDVFVTMTGQHVFQPLDEVYTTGQPLTLREWRVQVDMPTTGGSKESFIDLLLAPRTGPDGAIAGVTVVMFEVTERVRERQADQRRAAEAERRYEQARELIDTLQRELLPSGVPVLPRVQLAAGYLLADTDTAAGGDWFDALALPGGRVAMVVGDVVGHGVAASATMGQLRILLHEQLATGAGIPAALRALDAAAGRIRGARAATVCVLVLDPVTGDVEYCTGGHPPPLIVSPGGEARYLPVTGAGPLGVGGAFTGEAVGSQRLAPGELVLLYTDGILERPGRELAQSSVELAQVAGDIAAGRALPGDPESMADRVCTQILEIQTRLTGYSDDITLLAGQLVPPPADLTLRLTAGEVVLARIRDRFREWLAAARVPDEDARVLLHAVVELATNATEHAYLDVPGPHPVTVTATLTPAGEAIVRVADQGRWRPPAPSADRGLGLRLVTQLTDNLSIEHDEHGTTATVTHRPSCPACLHAADSLTWTPHVRSAPPADLLVVLDQPSAPGPRIRLDGPVDTVTVRKLEAAALKAGSSGGRSLTLDLAGVTHLASAGVSALHRLAARHRDNQSTLTLYAPVGSPADMILSLVQLDHVTDNPDPAG